MEQPTETKRQRQSLPGQIYREFLAEREEILRHKWLRSEAQGGDIGFDCALTEWIQVHRPNWRKSRSEQSA